MAEDDGWVGCSQGTGGFDVELAFDGSRLFANDPGGFGPTRDRKSDDERYQRGENHENRKKTQNPLVYLALLGIMAAGGRDRWAYGPIGCGDIRIGLDDSRGRADRHGGGRYHRHPPDYRWLYVGAAGYFLTPLLPLINFSNRLVGVYLIIHSLIARHSSS